MKMNTKDHSKEDLCIKLAYYNKCLGVPVGSVQLSESRLNSRAGQHDGVNHVTVKMG